MRITVHLSSSSTDPSDVLARLSNVDATGEVRAHEDGRGFDWSVEVPCTGRSFELEANRRVLEVGEALRHAAAAGCAVQIEIEIVRADRMQMNSHVGLGFRPEMLARLGAWGIALAVTSSLT